MPAQNFESWPREASRLVVIHFIVQCMNIKIPVVLLNNAQR